MTTLGPFGRATSRAAEHIVTSQPAALHSSRMYASAPKPSIAAYYKLTEVEGPSVIPSRLHHHRTRQPGAWVSSSSGLQSRQANLGLHAGQTGEARLRRLLLCNLSADRKFRVKSSIFASKHLW